MIVALHVATGATVGAAVRSRTAAALLGIPLHLAGDRVPHRDIHNRRFEVGSGLVLVGLLALRRGITDASTIGALAACSPDVEHIIRLPRPGGRSCSTGDGVGTAPVAFRPGRRWSPASSSVELALTSSTVVSALRGEASRRSPGRANGDVELVLAVTSAPTPPARSASGDPSPGTSSSARRSGPLPLCT